MGFLSKSPEEKEREKQQKLEKEQKEAKKALQVLGVDFDSYSDDEIREKNKVDLQVIGSTYRLGLQGELVANIGMKPVERILTGYLSTISTQNRILIRQGELIMRLLKKLVKDKEKDKKEAQDT